MVGVGGRSQGKASPERATEGACPQRGEETSGQRIELWSTPVFGGREKKESLWRLYQRKDGDDLSEEARVVKEFQGRVEGGSRAGEEEREVRFRYTPKVEPNSFLSRIERRTVKSGTRAAANLGYEGQEKATLESHFVP